MGRDGHENEGEMRIERKLGRTWNRGKVLFKYSLHSNIIVKDPFCDSKGGEFSDRLIAFTYRIPTHFIKQKAFTAWQYHNQVIQRVRRELAELDEASVRHKASLL